MIPQDIARLSDELFIKEVSYSWAISPFTQQSGIYPAWYGEWVNGFKVVGTLLSRTGKNGMEVFSFLDSDGCEINTDDCVPGCALKSRGWVAIARAIAQCGLPSGDGYFMNRRGRIIYVDHEMGDDHAAIMERGILDSWASLSHLLQVSSRH
jgi:hypothetical protein